MIKNIFFILFLCNFIKGEEKNLALVMKPVIDLFSKEIKEYCLLNDISLSPKIKTDLNSCPRIHQLLFNDVVKIIKKSENLFLVELSQLFYQSGKKYINTFWTAKENLFLLNDYFTEKIPNPVDFKTENKKEQKIVTLISPFIDQQTEDKYSAGTRFVYFDLKDEKYNVYAFNNDSKDFKILEIPKKFCLSNENLNKDLQISRFVKLLKKWANLKKGFIPYVWGGTSLISTSQDEMFEIIEKKFKEFKTQFFSYPNFNFNPKTGFDCSGLILRAAQICSIPFYFKNTTTISQNLKSLEIDEEIENGDLIWIPGHIIAITDVANNKCIEARDYSHGYGKVQEIELKKLFKNIKDFKILRQNFFQKKPIERLNIKQNVIEVITNFKILKLKSCWDWKPHN